MPVHRVKRPEGSAPARRPEADPARRRLRLIPLPGGAYASTATQAGGAPLQYNVAQLLKELVGATRSYELLADRDGAAGRVQLLRTDRGILVRGTVTTTWEGACNRCLAPMTLPLDLPIEEEFFPTVDVWTGAHLPPPDEAGALVIDQHHVLDLTECVRQYAVASEPIAPRCRPDCRGLCPQCGVNRNMVACACQASAADPRWEALSALRPRGGRSPETDTPHDVRRS